MQKMLIGILMTTLITGCATTFTEITGKVIEQPVCSTTNPPISATVYWGTNWRHDQKEPGKREVMAKKGIEQFFSKIECLEVASIRKLVWDDAPPSMETLRERVLREIPVVQRIIFIAVHELGPTLEIGIPVIIEGNTEVVIDIKVIDTQSSRIFANSKTHWRNGGKFVIKSTKTLSQDIGLALTASLINTNNDG